MLEHFEWSPPPDAFSLRRRSGGLGRLPAPDYAQLTHREYGHRVGVFRLLDILERHGITPTVAVDALTARHYPWLVDHCVGRGCEIVAHGVSATRLATSNLTVDAERDLIAESLAAVEAATGAGARGWYSAEGVESHRTPQLLAAAGVDYLLDWPNDEQPYPITTPAGEMVSLPMFLEADDEFALWHRRATLAGWADTVTAAAARMCHDGAHHRAGGRLLLLCLRPWLTGQPFRAPTLDRALATGIAPLLESGRAFAATTSEIADAYALSVGTVDVGADGQQE
ncbi:MAG TPA: hypothetical protein DEP69_07465 [Acidimicrobiaceae bacterium]|nr:hypothetical protein [Acidimicrobiaceae bacterium]